MLRDSRHSRAYYKPSDSYSYKARPSSESFSPLIRRWRRKPRTAPTQIYFDVFHNGLAGSQESPARKIPPDSNCSSTGGHTMRSDSEAPSAAHQLRAMWEYKAWANEPLGRGWNDAFADWIKKFGFGRVADAVQMASAP